MKRWTYPAGTTLTALAIIGLGVSGRAQQPPAKLVPFKATLTLKGAPTSPLVLPLTPPIGYFNLSTTGQSNLLGKVSYVDNHILHFAADGTTPLSDTNGVGVMTAANGDALFFTYSGLYRATGFGPPPSKGPGFELAFTISGGKGRFLGATGSGVIRRSVAGKLTDVFEGTVSAPKP